MGNVAGQQIRPNQAFSHGSPTSQLSLRFQEGPPVDGEDTSAWRQQAWRQQVWRQQVWRQQAWRQQVWRQQVWRQQVQQHSKHAGCISKDRV